MLHPRIFVVADIQPDDFACYAFSDVILISNGHWAVSKKYRELFDCPFPLFQDSSRKLYNVSPPAFLSHIP